MNASDCRSVARQALAGNWVTAVLVGLAATVLGGAASGGSMRMTLQQRVEQLQEVSPELAGLLMGIIGAVAIISLIYTLVMLVVGSAVQLGYVRYNLNLVDARPAQIGDLFTYFGRFGDALVLRLLMGLYVFAGLVLFVVPGIRAVYSYALAPYILAEDPECTPMEAMRRSKEMMNGYRMDLFFLDLSFIGWHLLSAVLLNLGQLLLTPYTSAARAVFYRDLQHRTRRGYSAYENYETE